MPLSDEWKRTVDDGLTNPAWDDYDSLIKSETDAYNARLKSTTGFVSLDWKNFKAMAWVESGALSPAWKTRPMQIGNKGDQGLTTLQKGLEGSLLIMSKQLQTDVSTPGKIDDPTVNIQAGMALMLVYLLRSKEQSVDLSSIIYQYQITSGDNFSSIANKLGTTVPSLEELNPLSAHKVLHLRQTILWRPARVERVITGWSSDFVGTAAKRYNTGDKNYADKMYYVLSLFPNLVRNTVVVPKTK